MSEPHPAKACRATFTESLHCSRPHLWHLNGDSSWLLSIPTKNVSSSNGRPFFNILIDPWLSGVQVDLAPWFSRQWHATDAVVKTIADLETALRYGQSEEEKGRERDLENEEMLDLVLISHEFTDHMHEATLKNISKAVPVVATAKAARIISGWDHFETVVDVSHFKGNLEQRDEEDYEVLPSWLNVHRLVGSLDPAYLNAAVLITFRLNESDDYEGIIYTPHGLPYSSLPDFSTCSPRISILALIHGLMEVNISVLKTINLGAHNGLGLARKANTKYWITTHDEIKTGKGMIGMILKNKQWTLEDALAKEAQKTKAANQTTRDFDFQELGSGETTVLI